MGRHLQPADFWHRGPLLPLSARNIRRCLCGGMAAGYRFRRGSNSQCFNWLRRLYSAHDRPSAAFISELAYRRRCQCGAGLYSRSALRSNGRGHRYRPGGGCSEYHEIVTGAHLSEDAPLLLAGIEAAGRCPYEWSADEHLALPTRPRPTFYSAVPLPPFLRAWSGAGFPGALFRTALLV